MVGSLPPNVHLMTYKTLKDGQVLLRLNHLFGVGESTNFSIPVTIDVSTLFVNYDVVSMKEMTLSANRPLDDLHRLKWKTNMEEDEQTVEQPRLKFTTVQDFQVVLNPMQIRTFMVRLQPL